MSVSSAIAAGHQQQHRSQLFCVLEFTASSAPPYLIPPFAGVVTVLGPHERA